jgi:hypothetical protein
MKQRKNLSWVLLHSYVILNVVSLEVGDGIKRNFDFDMGGYFRVEF